MELVARNKESLPAKLLMIGGADRPAIERTRRKAGLHDDWVCWQAGTDDRDFARFRFDFCTHEYESFSTCGTQSHVQTF